VKNKNLRTTWAEIDLGAVSHNLRQIRSFIDKKVEILPIVKANAYGHGILQVSRVLVDNGIKYLGVATMDEAMKLREHGIDVSILILGAVLEEEAVTAVKNNITLTICDNGLLDVIAQAAKKYKTKARVHVKIDTGMGRIGVWHEDAMPLMREVYKNKYIKLEGIYTHFSSSARDEMFTSLQIEFFDNVIRKMKEENIEVKYTHASSSIAIFDWKAAHLNMVRPGIVLYGIYPKETFRKMFKLRPVMALKTKIVFMKSVLSGRAISYGRTYITQKPTKIATIPIGYADGYGRILSNKAEALVRGQFVRVVGVVTMDQTMLDVGEVEDVKVGDEVVLVGDQGVASIPVEKVAKLARTIPYEIVVGIMERVPRIYLK